MIDDSILWLESCQSTNDEAAKHLSSRRYSTVVSNYQSSGRGRMGRTWHSPGGCGLYLSHIAFPRFDQKAGGAIPLMAGVAVAETCEALGVEVQLKWPNDVIIGNRKLAGILCEAQGHQSQWSIIIGIGLNLKTPAFGWPNDLPAIGLDAIHEEELDHRIIAREIVRRLEQRLLEIESHGAAPIYDAWSKRSLALGTRIRRGDLEGHFAGLSPEGGLLLQTTSGMENIKAGDIDLLSEE